MPSLLGYAEQFGKLPCNLTFSLAALMAFYTGKEIRGKALIGTRNGEEYQIIDDMQVLEFFRDHYDSPVETAVSDFLGENAFWGCDLNEVAGLTEAVTGYLNEIRTNGVRKTLCSLL